MEETSLEYKEKITFEKSQRILNRKLKTIALTGDSLNEEEHKQRLNEEMIINPDRSVSCNLCGKKTVGKDFGNVKQKMRNHIETHIDGLSYPCQYCEKTFRLENFHYSYRNHIYIS